jgi:hypothetical protein
VAAGAGGDFVCLEQFTASYRVTLQCQDSSRVVNLLCPFRRVGGQNGLGLIADPAIRMIVQQERQFVFEVDWK